MIKVEKPTDSIPDILSSDDTQTKLQELIKQKKWLSGKYENPYGNKEVKKALKAAYKNKCAFCEQKLRPAKKGNKSFPNEFTIEHFRPKSRYYWLAYSYDNLLPTCFDCNNEKDNSFETLISSIIRIDSHEITTIHVLAAIYNKIEQPKFIHPELEDLSEKFIYHKDGTVTSDNIRCQYVIDICKLSRSKLILKRRKIINKIKSILQSAIFIKDEAIRNYELLQLRNFLKKNGESQGQEFSNLYAFYFRNFEKIDTIIL